MAQESTSNLLNLEIYEYEIVILTVGYSYYST